MAKYIIQHRRGTTEQWQSSDVILHNGEIAIEDRIDGTRGVIIGDGISTYNELSKMYLQEVWTLDLPASGWIKSPIEGVCEDRWCQNVDIPLNKAHITPHSKVDLQPTDAVIALLIEEEISLTTINVDGSISVVAIGAAPSKDISVQATKTEVMPV